MAKKRENSRRARKPNARKDNIVKRLSRKLGVSAFVVFKRAFEHVFTILDLKKVKEAFVAYKKKLKIPEWVHDYFSFQATKPA